MVLLQLLNNVNSVHKHAAVRGGVDVHVLLTHNLEGPIMRLANGSLSFTLDQARVEPKGKKGR